MRRSIPVCVDSVEALLWLLLRGSAMATWGCYRDDHKEETIVIGYFLYTDVRLRWIAAPTLFLLPSASSGNDP
jgi:hypothetical protein